MVVCFGSEHNSVRTERNDTGAQVQASCPTTKAIEVCVNGVKQVIIIPLAPSSDDATAVSSAAFLPGCQSSSSVIDDVPDDVKLLAQSCLPVTSSSSVSVSLSSFDKSAASSAATDGHTWLQQYLMTGSTNHTIPPPPPYQYSVSRIPFACLSTVIPQNPYIAATPQFYTNSVNNTATLPPGIIPRASLSFQAVSSLSTPVLPVCGFPPVQQLSNTALMRTPLQQPLPFSRPRNTDLPSQIHPGLNHLQHMATGMMSQAPGTSCSPLQTRPTFDGNSTISYLTDSSYWWARNATKSYQQASNLSLSDHGSNNYQHFLPSLQSAITPNLPGNFPVQFQHYLFRKRGVMPQNAAPDVQLNTGNHYMPQFDPRLFANHGVTFQRPPSVNANEVQTSYPNLSWAFTSSYSAYLNSISDNSVRSRDARKQRTGCRSQKESVNKTSFVNKNNLPSASSVSQENVSFEPPNVWCEPLQPSSSGISRPVISSACQTTASSTALLLPNEPEWLQNNIDTSCHQPGLQVSLNLTQPTLLPLTTIAPSSVAAITTRVSDTTTLLRVTTIATSSAAPVTTCVNETTCHQTAVMQASTAAASNSTENSTLNSLLFDVGSDLTASNVPSNCCLTSNASLTDVLSLTSVSVSDLSATVTESDVVQQNGTGLEIGLGDNSNDLESLPADVMVETAESESLLMSFCNMFEQSNATRPHLTGMSSLVTSDRVKDRCESSEQRKDSSVRHENTERGLQIAKSLGKGQHFAEEMRQRRQASRKRRRTKLTSLEVADESNSSDSWHPDNQSESSDYLTPTPTPSPDTSVSQSSDDFIVFSRRAKRRRIITHRNRKRYSKRTLCSAQKSGKAAVYSSPIAVSQNCTVRLERLRLQGRHSVNVHIVDSLICCPLHSSFKPIQRIVSSDSECSTVDSQPNMKLRIKIPPIQDTDSS